MAHQIHFLLPDKSTSDFFQFVKTTIQVVEWHLYVILCLLTSPKFYFGEVEKAMFQVVRRHWELIFFILIIPKCDLGDVE